MLSRDDFIANIGTAVDEFVDVDTSDISQQWPMCSVCITPVLLGFSVIVALRNIEKAVFVSAVIPMLNNFNATLLDRRVTEGMRSLEIPDGEHKAFRVFLRNIILEYRRTAPGRNRYG